MLIKRREFLQSGVMTIGACVSGCLRPSSLQSKFYPGWQEGELDIHFIHTGVGEQTFFIFPDATTMLLDCGDTHHAKYMVDVPPMPSADRLGGDWTARYIKRLIPKREIDYLFVSHWHGDHVGDPSLGYRADATGHKLCGITAVAQEFRFRNYLDHQYPHTGKYARDIDPEAFEMMQEWIPRAARETGMKIHPFQVGACNQIKLLHNPKKYGDFSVRNIAANAVLWDGKDGTIDYGEKHIQGGGEKCIHENRLSAVIRMNYGNFSYYSGGDAELTLSGEDGKEFNWEEVIGKAVGKVNVCKTNHHAGSHGMSAGFVKAVSAQVYLSSVWQAGMVNKVSLDNMTSRELYPGERTICFGYIADKVRSLSSQYADDLAPTAGHTVVKVLNGGTRYRVYSLDASNETMRIQWEKTYEC